MFDEYPGTSGQRTRVTLDGHRPFGDKLPLTGKAEMLAPRQPSEA